MSGSSRSDSMTVRAMPAWTRCSQRWNASFERCQSSFTPSACFKLFTPSACFKLFTPSACFKLFTPSACFKLLHAFGVLQAVEHGLNCPAVGIEPDDRLRRHGRRQQQPVLGPTPLDAQRDPDGADLQTAEEAGPEAAEADRHIVVDAEALLDDRQEGELVALEPHAVLGRPSAPAPRPQPGSQQRPEALEGVDLAEAIAVPGVFASTMTDGLVAVAETRKPG